MYETSSITSPVPYGEDISQYFRFELGEAEAWMLRRSKSRKGLIADFRTKDWVFPNANSVPSSLAHLALLVIFSTS